MKNWCISNTSSLADNIGMIDLLEDSLFIYSNLLILRYFDDILIVDLRVHNIPYSNTSKHLLR